MQTDYGTEVLALAAVLTLMGGLFLFIYSIGGKLAILQLKVDTIWSFMFKRMKLEGLEKDWMVEHSPLQMTQQAIDAMEPLKMVLKEWYNHDRHNLLTDQDLVLAIERKFGDELVEQVCKPYGLSNGVCLIAAAMVCGRTMSLLPSNGNGSGS